MQIDERFGPARLGLARSHEKLGNCPGALAEYVRAADLLPDDRALQVTAGNYLLSARRFDEAKARAEAVLAVDPKHVEAQVLLGNSLAGLRNIDQAIIEIEEAIRTRSPARRHIYEPRRPRDGTWKGGRGRAGIQANGGAGSQMGARTSCARQPLLGARSRHAEAEAGAAHGPRRSSPRIPSTNRAMAVFYVATNKPDRGGAVHQGSRRVGRRAICARGFLSPAKPSGERDPRAPATARTRRRTASAAGRRLAQAYAMRGDFDDAHRVVEELLQKDPKDAQTLLLKGQLLAQEGKREEAFAQLQAAAQIDRDSAELQLRAGTIAYGARRHRSGAPGLHRGTAVESARRQRSGRTRRLDLVTGRVGTSVQHAREAVKNEPTNLAAQVALIRSLLASKDVAGAKAVLDPLIAANPDEPMLLGTARLRPVGVERHCREQNVRSRAPSS